MQRHKGEEETALEAFWSRKHEELAYLNKYAGPGPIGIPQRELAEFNRSVREIRKRILHGQVECTASLSETSPVGPERYLSPAGPVVYGYQRYDLRRVDVDWLREVYFAEREAQLANGLFFSCGMSAIAALFAIFARQKWQRVQFSPEPYFESFLLAKRFFERISFDQADSQFSPDRDVLFLDTSSLNWPKFPEHVGSTRLIVVDTSCVEPDSRHTNYWMDEAARLQLPMVLVRSHVKLDSFGLELGRLGSAIVISPDDQKSEGDALIQELLQARSGFGTGFSLIALYPWLGDLEFARLARLRTTAIREVTQRLRVALLEVREPGDRFEVLPTAHGIFLVIRTHLDIGGDGHPPRPGDAIKSFVLSRTIAKACADHCLPVIAAPSFGLDQITLNDFVNLHDGQHHLRVSGADIPHSLLFLVAVQIRRALVNFADAHGGSHTNN